MDPQSSLHEGDEQSIQIGRLLIGLLALALAASWSVIPPTDSLALENRPPTPFPTVTWRSVMDASVFRQTDAAVRDRSALRFRVIRAVGSLGTNLSDPVVVTDDGTPFLAADFVLPCEHLLDAAAVAAGLRSLSESGRSNGKTITVTVVPDKSTVLHDRFGRRAAALFRCVTPALEATERQWPNSPDSPLMTMRQELTAAEHAAPGRIYQRGDSHWTSEGGLIYARSLIERLVDREEAPTTMRGLPDAVRGSDAPARGDLYRLRGSSRKDTVPVWSVSRPGTRTRTRYTTSTSGENVPTHQTVADRGLPLVPGRTLVICDSFFGQPSRLLPPYFEELTVMSWSALQPDAEAGPLPPFDRVILESVQREWPERSNWLKNGAGGHGLLERELSRP